MTADGHFSWPSAGSYVTAYGQVLVAAVTSQKETTEGIAVCTPVYPLSPELEELWREMQELRRHPRYSEALEHLDPRFREPYENLMAIPRVWLADRREAQVREAMAAIESALIKLP